MFLEAVKFLFCVKLIPKLINETKMGLTLLRGVEYEGVRRDRGTLPCDIPVPMSNQILYIFFLYKTINDLGN